ncbi:unnamed protein product, partial [Peniophora sp. CBMAI 1063]
HVQDARRAVSMQELMGRTLETSDIGRNVMEDIARIRAELSGAPAENEEAISMEIQPTAGPADAGPAEAGPAEAGPSCKAGPAGPAEAGPSHRTGLGQGSSSAQAGPSNLKKRTALERESTSAPTPVKKRKSKYM